MNWVMEDIEDILAVMEESKELARRIEALQQRLGNVGSPELSDIGGTVTMFLSLDTTGMRSPRAGCVVPAVDGFGRVTAP